MSFICFLFPGAGMPTQSTDVFHRIAGGKDSEKQKRKEKKKQEREKLKKGEKVMSVDHTYTVLDLLGSGGFGDVYKVEQETGKVFAMKTESDENKVADKRLLRLKMETMIFSDCAQITEPARKKHFVHMEDKGRTLSYKFLVMGLVGPSLQDIRHDVLQHNFTRPTAQIVCMQTFQSIWDLHLLGYIHRDIKPQNFAVGLEENQNTVYMLDFGIARKIVDKDGANKPARARAKFIGTVRYASRNCHSSKEQGRHDDVEVWLYMVIDLFDTYLIPWRGECDRAKVLEKKKMFFEGTYDSKIYKQVPIGYRKIVEYVDTLTYDDMPDYKNCMQTLRNIAEDEKLDLNAKVDWYSKPRKKEVEKKRADTDEQKEDSDDSDSASPDPDKKGNPNNLSKRGKPKPDSKRKRGLLKGGSKDGISKEKQSIEEDKTKKTGRRKKDKGGSKEKKEKSRDNSKEVIKPIVSKESKEQADPSTAKTPKTVRTPKTSREGRTSKDTTVKRGPKK